MNEKRLARLNQTRFHRPNHVSLTYIAQPEYGVTLAEVLDDAFWAHVSHELKAGFFIEVCPEGLPYYARLLVIHAEPSRAVVKLLQFVDLVNEAAKPATAEILQDKAIGTKFRAERNGKWFRVIRVGDQEVMKTGFVTMAEAEAWAEKNLSIGA